MKNVLIVILSMFLVQGLAACSDGNGTPEDTQQDETLPDVTHDPDAETAQEEALEVPPEGEIQPEVTDIAPDRDVTPDVPSDVTPANGVVGDACVSGVQCGGVPGDAKECLTNIMSYVQFEGGYCTATCTTDADCDADVATCVNLVLVRYCLKTCDTVADCRASEGYNCAELPSLLGVDGTFCIPNFSMGDGIDF